MVAIANATTTVAVAKTVGEIMELLTRLGARAVMVRYDTHYDPFTHGPLDRPCHWSPT